MYVSPDKKFAFIAHPRTASRATAKAIGLPYFQDTGHHPAKGSVCQFIQENGGIVACTIRNPFDIAVSWYYNEHYTEEGVKHPGKGGYEFHDWVIRTKLKHNQWLAGPLYHYGLPQCNHVMRFENLEEDLKELCDIVGRKYVPTKPYGVLRKDKDYRKFYDYRARKIVEIRFARDFELTGYEF